MVFGCSKSAGQNKKIPISILFDSINSDREGKKYELPAFYFEYDNESRLIKMTDSVKKKSKFRVRELLFVYDKKGKLTNYSYQINGELEKGHNITYENNKVIMTSVKKIGYKHIMVLDKFNKAVSVKSTHTNAYFNSSSKPTYYDDGNVKKAGNYTYMYRKEKGVFSNVNMEPWCRLFFDKLITLSLQKRNVSERKTYQNRKSDDYSTKSYEYEIKANHPSKLVNGKIIYTVSYLND